MDNLLSYDQYKDSELYEYYVPMRQRRYKGTDLNPFQKLMNNLDNYSISQKYRGDTTTPEGATRATIGRIIGKIAGLGTALSDDFGIKIKDDTDPVKLIRNKRAYLKQWEIDNLTPAQTFEEAEVEKIYRELDAKGKRRFGENFDFLNAKGKKTPEQEAWSDYAVGILKRYAGRVKR